jgi:hypothetical protein
VERTLTLSSFSALYRREEVEMLFLTLFVVVFLTITLGPILFLRQLGRRQRPAPMFAVVQPLNTTAIVIGSPNTDIVDKDENPVRVNNDGGKFIDMIVNGWVMDKRDQDPMHWVMLTEEEAKKAGLWPELEKGILFTWFNIQIIGLFRYIEINSVRKFRWGRPDNEKEYRMMPKTDHHLYPPFTGQHDFLMDNVETSKVIAFIVRGNLQVREKYPYRVRKLTADAYAQLTIIVNDEIANFVRAVDPMEFFTASETKQKRALKGLGKRLIAHVKSPRVKKRIEDGTGIEVFDANLPELDFTPDTRTLLEAVARAEFEGSAKVMAARKAKDAKILANDAEADYIERVIMRVAENRNAVMARGFEAYEKNRTMKTLVLGGQGVLPTLPLSDDGEDKAEKP